MGKELSYLSEGTCWSKAKSADLKKIGAIKHVERKDDKKTLIVTFEEAYTKRQSIILYFAQKSVLQGKLEEMPDPNNPAQLNDEDGSGELSSSQHSDDSESSDNVKRRRLASTPLM